ncbi:MAG: ParB/RepB/Spo0J family partition protein [Burkholderiaceae bacterium]|nr:ParB/RepB/Spo0J family partition protein [Burkholderiaceae bacterium]
MVKKNPRGLGLGLEALLGPKVNDVSAANDQPAVLKLSQLQAGKYQPRTQMDEASLHELAQSIKCQGVMQPVLVRPLAAGRYEVIAGERRLRAAKLAGLDELPVLVKAVSDQAAAVMALIENIQREDLNPIEEAQGLQRLISEFGLTHEQVAATVGRSRSAASNLLRLLNLAKPVQQMLMSGELEMGHGRALLALDKAQQITHAAQIVTKKLSARQAEALVARTSNRTQRKSPPPARPGKSRDVLRLEEALSDHLAAKVEVRVKKDGTHGEVAIAFSSLDELDGVIERIKLPH